jgi:hypothetical protein
VTLESEALKALAPFPYVEAAVAILILAIGGLGILKALREKKPTNSNGAPAWSLYGPAADAMKAIHEMTEQSRVGNSTMSRIESTVTEMSKQQREATMLLEDIRNNQVQRGDITPSPVRRKPL